MIKKIIRSFFNLFGYTVSKKNPQYALVRWAHDEAFLKVADRVRDYTLLGLDRLYTLWQFGFLARQIEGGAAQVGVYKGGSALLVREALGFDKHLHLFDTFSGMPPVRDDVDIHKEGDFNDTSLDSVRTLFKNHTNVHFYSGVFPETSGPIADATFSFVYIDTDIYESTRDALQFFYPRVNAGGVLIFDDYKGKHTPGVERALHEFLADKKEVPIITAIAQCAVIKQ